MYFKFNVYVFVYFLCVYLYASVQLWHSVSATPRYNLKIHVLMFKLVQYWRMLPERNKILIILTMEHLIEGLPNPPREDARLKYIPVNSAKAARGAKARCAAEKHNAFILAFSLFKDP